MILITGSTGFVGTHLVRGLAEAGHKVRALVRDPASAGKFAGLDVETAAGDVGNPDSLVTAARGCDAVIHLVGIIQPGPGYTFRSVHVEGTRNVLEAAKRAGTVRQFIYQSALGTRPDAPTEYFRTKHEAEKLTKVSGLEYTITRPSIIYGKGDGFTTKLIEIIKLSPVVPVIGTGRTLFQPVYVGDLVQAFLKIIYNEGYFGRTLEICGPGTLSFDEIVESLMGALGSRKVSVHVPLSLVRPAAFVMERLLPKPPVTTDQLKMLDEDNVCRLNALEEMGIRPVPFREGLAKFIK